MISKLVHVCTVLYLLSVCQQVYAVTLVYNLRIRRAFNLSAALDQEKKALRVATVLPLMYNRTRIITDNNNLDLVSYECRCVRGSLFNLRYISAHSGYSWWAEVTTAVAKECAKSRGAVDFTACRTGVDDIVVTGGYSRHIHKRAQYVLYGLVGFPTRRKVTLLERYDTFLGTRFFSVGLGIEFSYSLVQSLKKSCVLVLQSRFLHFFKRSWYPILPADAILQPGDVIDLLCTVQYRKSKNIIEVGYNPAWFVNQAVLLSTGPVMHKKEFMRQGAYASFNHVYPKFPVIDRPVILGVGLSSTRSKQFNTSIKTYWFNVSTIF